MELTQLLIRPDDLKAFAKSELNIDLDTAESTKLARTYSTTIRGYLAALERKKDQPPFVVRDWRELSALRRRLFGVSHRSRKGLECGLRVLPIVESGGFLYGIAHDVKIQKPKHKAVHYRRFIFIHENMWKTKPAKEQPMDAVFNELVETYRLLSGKRTKGKLTVDINLARIRKMIPKSKARQQRNTVQLVDDVWPFEGCFPDSNLGTISLEELSCISSLFGDSGSATGIRGDGFLLIFNKWATVLYTAPTKLLKKKR